MSLVPQSLEVIIFYFDIIGIRDDYLSAGSSVLDRLRKFQAAVRGIPLGLGCYKSVVMTLADNVWARVNTSEPAAEYTALNLAGSTMQEAIRHGFKRFFGVVTRGILTYEISDDVLHSRADPTDISLQHIGMTSDPHIRAAMAEKWSGDLVKQGKSPGSALTWVSEEVFGNPLGQMCAGQALNFTILPNRIDLTTPGLSPGKAWPFPHQAKFDLIAP